MFYLRSTFDGGLNGCGHGYWLGLACKEAAITQSKATLTRQILQAETQAGKDHPRECRARKRPPN